MPRVQDKDGREFLIRDDQQKALEELDRYQSDDTDEQNGEKDDYYLHLFMESLNENYAETTQARLAELNVRLKDESLPDEGSRRPPRIRFSQELVQVAASPPPDEAECAAVDADDDNERSQTVGLKRKGEDETLSEQEPVESVENETDGNKPTINSAKAEIGANSGANNSAKSSANSNRKSPHTTVMPAANRKHQQQQQHQRTKISYDHWRDEKRRQAQLESERAQRQRELEERNRHQAQDELKASRPTLADWLAGKRLQSLRDQLYQLAEEDEILLSSREVHTPQQCHRAYRLWLRRKEDQNRREAKELRERLRSAEQVMRRNQLSRTPSIASASPVGFYRYLDYYGYR